MCQIKRLKKTPKRGKCGFAASLISHCALQTGTAEALPGAAEEAGPTVIGLDEEHHSEPAETSPASHKGARCLNLH